MSVTFGTPVVAIAQTAGTMTFAMSGVTPGQPIVVAIVGAYITPAHVSDTFSTPYTWAAMSGVSYPSAPPGAVIWLGTGGAGTSGTITVTTTAGQPTGGVAIPCVGASTAAGAAAIDVGFQSYGTSAAPSIAYPPGHSGDGAVFIVNSLSGITASPGSPWTDTGVSFSGTTEGSVATYPSPPTGVATTASWTTAASAAWCAALVFVNQATAPPPPIMGTATPGNGQATVSFSPPSNTGGEPITSYTATASPGGASASSSGSPITIPGLTNGTAYTITVTATNSVGTSIASAPSNSVTPATVPNPPTLSAGAGNTTAVLSWSPPAFDGGTAITGYDVYQGTSPGGESATPVNAAPITGTSYTVTGLTNLTPYYFTVKAINSVGLSAASNEVTATPEPPVGSVSAPLLTAIAGLDPLSGAPIVTLTVTNTQALVGSWPAPLAFVLRSDGTYVLGASPSNPIAAPVGTPVTIVDRTAAYGLSAGYTAFVVYGGTTSAPSFLASAVMGEAPDTEILFNRLGWAADEDATGVLLQWLAGIGQMMQRVDTLARDGFDANGIAAPGWSQVLDIDRAPTYVLPWLAQFLGVRLDPTWRDDQARYAIENPQGFGRGTPAALIAAADQYLIPGASATLIERDTSPYHLSITIPTAGIAGLSTCESLVLEYTTCSAVLASFATCAALWTVPAEISSAVQAAIPAGLVATITYV